MSDLVNMSITMTPTKRQAYLLKDREIHFAFERNRDAQVSNNHLRIALLYKANKDSFVRYPGELYNDEHIRQIHKAIQTETENSANCRIDMLANFDKFYQEVKVLTIVKFPERFVKSLLNYVAEPKISIRGSYKLIWHDCTAHEDPWMILDGHVHEFNVPAISLKENQPVIKSTNFNGASKMTQFYITELLSDVRMKYSVILEWKDFSVNAEAVRIDVLDKLYSDKVLANCVLVASNGEELWGHRSIFAAQSTVFHAMLTSGLRESHTNRIELEDVSKSCLEILLAYCYGRHINLEQIPDDIATQLIQAAHKYDIAGLERVMLQLLCSKCSDWFTIDNMIALYYFCVNVDGDRFRILTEKLLSIMKRNPHQLRASEACQNFIKEHPQEAADLLMKLLEHEQN